MSEDASAAQPPKLFICCFEYTPDQDLASLEDDGNEDGAFQLVVEARDVDDAATKCRARLHELAATSDSLGPIVVYANVFIEVAPGDLARGVVINHQKRGDVIVDPYLPAQGDTATVEHLLDDVGEGEREGGDVAEHEVEEQEDDEDRGNDGEDVFDGPPVPVFWAKWKLYWCETDDHDEDWFVVARSAWQASAFHEAAEGYDEGDASAEYVCVLPGSVQLEAERKGRGWPSGDTLLACGAEFVPYVPQDGFEELRKNVGSGARIVRINGRVYSEGDIVSNTRQRLGGEPDA
jgi:hypothetical protein